MSDRPSGKLPVLVLILITPLIAELSWGSLPIQVAYALPFLVPIYGCGALLARELVRRAGRGWASLLLLGVGYEVLEDGFGLRAMFSPHTYHAAQWGARALGVNWAYTEFNIVYHAAFTIAVPILITDMIFANRQHRPYLRTRGLVITTAGYLVGVALLRFAVAPNAPGAVDTDPVPTRHLVVAGAAVIALAVVALRLLPRPHRRARPGRPPAPWLVGVVVAAGTVLALRIPAPVEAVSDPHPLAAGWLVPVQLAVSLAVAGVVLTALWRWAARDGWSRLHCIGIAAGALLAHTVVGAWLFAPGNPAELVTLAVFALLEMILIIVLYRRASQDRFFALRTFRRDGEAKVTPIWLAPSGGRWYAYTPVRSWKVKRIRHTSRVEVAAATFHGEPLGPWQSGHARIMTDQERGTAIRAMTARYGSQFRTFRLLTRIGRFRRHGGPAVGLEITLDDEPRIDDQVGRFQDASPSRVALAAVEKKTGRHE